MVLDKKEKGIILLAVGISAIFLGMISIIDIAVYGRVSSLIFPILIIIVGTYILYQSLEKLLKRK